MDENRRSFLKKAGCTALGIGGGLPMLVAARSAVTERSEDSTSQWAMVIDLRKLLELPKDQQKAICDACARACHQAHNVPEIPDPQEEVKWIWAEKFEHAFPDQFHPRASDRIKAADVPVLCNHCDRPSCVRVCPTKATWKRKDGLVMMDMHRCIGCRYCMAACPYGARSFNWRDPRERDLSTDELLYFRQDLSHYPARTKGVVEKCTFCAERIRESGDPKPACVEAAEKEPGGQGILTFGKRTEADSPVSRKLRENHTICRRVGLGTGPNVYYII